MSDPTIADVGVERFNNDHQRLLFYVLEFTRLARRFGERAPFEDEWDQVDGIFPRLDRYVAEHFQAEEELMRIHAYPHREEHAAQHAQLSRTLDTLRHQVEERRAGAVAQLEGFLLEWLQTHVNREDLKYRGFFQLVETREIGRKALFNEMISVEQLHRIVQAPPPEAVLLDLRTPVEQREGVIPGSVLLPCDHNLENRQDTEPFRRSFDRLFDPLRFDREKWYILICRSGPRTAIALPYFLDHGLQACELIGGVMEWTRQGHELIAPSA